MTYFYGRGMTIALVFLVLLAGLSACGGAGGVSDAPEDAASSSGAASTSEGTVGSAASDILQTATVTLDFSRTRALLIEDEDVDDAATGAMETNFWTLDEAGNLAPVISGGDGVDGKSIEIERIDTAPTGEIYLLFAHSVFLTTHSDAEVVAEEDAAEDAEDDAAASVAGARCKWVVVSLELPDQAICADPDTSFDFAEIKFAADGTVYYSDTSGRIKMRTRDSAAITTVFAGGDIGFAIDSFLPAPDGSLVVNGNLEGTSQHFFRLLPEQNGGVTIEEQCLQSVKVKVKGSAPGRQMLLASDDSLYVRSTQSVCGDLPAAKIYRGTFVDGRLEFSPIFGVDADYFAEDSQGGVYAIEEGDENDPTLLTRVSEAPYEAVSIPLTTIETIRVVGDAVYATGRDAAGRYAFLRKNLLDEAEVTDLLGGQDLVVQHFQVDQTGDVYFSAVDYADAGRELFRYVSEDGSLESVAALPSDVKEIIFMGQLDHFGIEKGKAVRHRVAFARR